MNPHPQHPDSDNDDEMVGTLLDRRRETLGVYAAPGHPLCGLEAVREADLAGVPLLLTSHSCSFRQMLLEDLADASVTPQIALETSSKEILRQFAVNELGVAFMPEMTVRNELEKGLLKKLDWTGNRFRIVKRHFAAFLKMRVTTSIVRMNARSTCCLRTTRQSIR